MSVSLVDHLNGLTLRTSHELLIAWETKAGNLTAWTLRYHLNTLHVIILVINTVFPRVITVVGTLPALDAVFVYKNAPSGSLTPISLSAQFWPLLGDLTIPLVVIKTVLLHGLENTNSGDVGFQVLERRMSG
jgi:hypothetical protein